MMRTESKNSWLQAIFNEMQEFKKKSSIKVKDVLVVQSSPNY